MITVQERYENSGQAWGHGACLVLLQIDRDTGTPTLEQAFCVDDAGTLIHPEAAHGQIIGGFAQGVGEALMERVVYDAEGQLLSGSFMDYAMPRADDAPWIAFSHEGTPSTANGW